MKIYHIGLCATPNTNNGLQKAFRRVSDYREIHTSHPALNSHIIKECKEFQPDIVFMQIQTPNIVEESIIKKIRPYVGKIINFTGDVREPVPDWYISLGKLIDHTLFVSQDNVLEARKRGITAQWMQIGFDPEIFNDQVPIIEGTPEVVFMANNYSHFPLSVYRKSIAQALYDKYGSRFGLYGTGWSLPHKDCNGNMNEQASILRSCKIAISCSNYDHKMYVSDRVLRIMGSGAFCLSHQFQDSDELYIPGSEIGLFLNIADMLDTCDFYLEHDQIRTNIAKAGYELTHNNWTWNHMINYIIELCQKS